MKFATPDTALAAWLYMNGAQLVAISKDGKPSTFDFEDSEEKLKELIFAYQTGNATGNIIGFYRSYKFLLTRLKT